MNRKLKPAWTSWPWLHSTDAQTGTGKFSWLEGGCVDWNAAGVPRVRVTN
jgi:hypothetical protein